MKQTNGSLKNFFYGEEDILDRDRFLQLHGAGESQILTADGTVNNVRLYKEDATDEAGRQIWVMSVLRKRFLLKNWILRKASENGIVGSCRWR